MFGAGLFIFFSAIIFTSILNFFIRSEFIYTLLLFSGAIIYGVYLVYDVQILVGGSSRKLDIDDYIIGAMSIYLDILNLFLKILKILDKISKSENKNKKKWESKNQSSFIKIIAINCWDMFICFRFK